MGFKRTREMAGKRDTSKYGSFHPVFSRLWGIKTDISGLIRLKPLKFPKRTQKIISLQKVSRPWDLLIGVKNISKWRENAIFQNSSFPRGNFTALSARSSIIQMGWNLADIIVWSKGTNGSTMNFPNIFLTPIIRTTLPVLRKVFLKWPHFYIGKVSI